MSSWYAFRWYGGTLDLSGGSGSVQSGTIVFIDDNQTIPAGYLECNGGAVSVDDNVALNDAINGSFNSFSTILSTRTDDDSGILTVESGVNASGFTTDSCLDLSWNDIIEVSDYTLNDTSGSTSIAGQSWRQIIDSSQLSGGGNKIKIILSGGTSGDRVVNHVSVGVRTGSAFDTVDTPVEITFDSSSGLTIEDNNTHESDIVDFTFDGNTDLIIILDFNSTQSGNSNTARLADANSPVGVYSSSATYNQADVADTPTTNYNYIYHISEINAGSIGTRTVDITSSTSDTISISGEEEDSVLPPEDSAITATISSGSSEFMLPKKSDITDKTNIKAIIKK